MQIHKNICRNVEKYMKKCYVGFGIIPQPFFPNFVRPESGHEFTRVFRQSPWYSSELLGISGQLLGIPWSFLVFHRASWCSVKLTGIP